MRRPFVDLHPVGILMNDGQFKGSGLDNISGKTGNGLSCLQYYNDKEYKKIEAYIQQEADAYIKLLVWLKVKMPKVLAEFQVDCI